MGLKYNIWYICESKFVLFFRDIFFISTKMGTECHSYNTIKLLVFLANIVNCAVAGVMIKQSWVFNNRTFDIS